MMTTQENSLSVFVEGVVVGYLHNTEPLALSYAEDALSGLLPVPFAGLIPLQTGKIASPAVLAFFENLLPEGDRRALLEMRYHVSSVFGLLSEVGGDAAGSVVVLPFGKKLETKDYVPASWDEIKRILSGDASDIDALTDKSLNHTSISGAQNKLLLSLADDGSPLLPRGASISTHILKPDIIRPGSRIWGSAANEALVMLTAQACGLPVAEVSYLPEIRSCLIKRYDRIEDPVTKTIERVYQADLCQLLGKPSTIKYESDGGPSFKDCFQTIKEKSASPIVDCHNALKWLLFNLCAGNNDSHAKNLSMMMNVDGKLRLAPFYDLMCTRAYPGLSANFAFKIGENYQPGLISRKDLSSLAHEIGVTDKFLFDLALGMAKAIRKEIPDVALSLRKQLDHNDQVIVGRIVQTVQGIAKKMESRLQDIGIAG